jgi:GGDEF domain-containing protein
VSPALAATVAVAGAALVAAALLAARARRRARARAERRAAALERLAGAMHRAAAGLDGAVTRADLRPRVTLTTPGTAAPAVDPATGLPGRSAFVQALQLRVAEAKHADERLGLGLVLVSGSGTALDDALGRVATVLRDAAPEGEPYRTGEHALALLLPGTGRAGTLAALARVEAALGGQPAVASRAVELEPGEDAISFLVRVAGEAEPRPRPSR